MAQSISKYLIAQSERREINTGPRSWDSPAGRLKKRLIRSPQMRYRTRAALTAAMAPIARRKAERLAERPDLRLHLGSHLQRKAGFVNIDLAGIPVDLAWDIRKPLPFRDGSIAAVFHEHVLEHLTLADGLQLARECLRVLRPGGVLRISVPDAGAALATYARGEGEPTALLRAQELFYEYGHRTMYDEPTLSALLQEAGFVDIRAHQRGESRIDPCPDGDRQGSLFVEGVRRPAEQAGDGGHC